MMPQQTDRLTCKSHRSVFGALIFHHAVVFLLLTQSYGGQPQPIVARFGDDITLPCHVKHAMDAADMMLEWSRPNLDPRFVHVRRSGQDRLVDQNPSYEGRTSVSIDGLKHGDVSLKLSTVKVSDEGTYKCFIPALDSVTNVQLGVVSDAAIQITRVSSRTLQCDSAGWYPEPEVLWLDGEGNLLSAGHTETVRGPDDLYTVSSRVTVEKRHSNSFTCRVQQKDTNHTREANIDLTEDFAKDSYSSAASTAVGLVVGMLFILGVAFVGWKWRQHIKNKKPSVDEETPSGGQSKDSETKALLQKETDGEQLTAETETTKNQEELKGEHTSKCSGEETGLLCQSKEETPHQRTEAETNNTFKQQSTEDKTESVEDKTPDPAGTETHQKQAEADKKYSPETAAPGQEGEDGQKLQTQAEDKDKNDTDTFNKEQKIGSIDSKPAGQGSTGGETEPDTLPVQQQHVSGGREAIPYTDKEENTGETQSTDIQQQTALSAGAGTVDEVKSKENETSSPTQTQEQQAKNSDSEGGENSRDGQKAEKNGDSNETDKEKAEQSISTETTRRDSTDEKLQQNNHPALGKINQDTPEPTSGEKLAAGAVKREACGDQKEDVTQRAGEEQTPSVNAEEPANPNKDEVNPSDKKDDKDQTQSMNNEPADQGPTETGKLNDQLQAGGDKHSGTEI